MNDLQIRKLKLVLKQTLDSSGLCPEIRRYIAKEIADEEEREANLAINEQIKEEEKNGIKEAE